MITIIKRLNASKKLVTIHTTWNISVIGIFESLKSDDVFDKTSEDSCEEKTGWMRLKKMFSYSKEGMPSPQLTLVSETALCSFIFGLITGGCISSKDAMDRFIEQNKLTAFADHYAAKRKLQEKVFLAFMKGGWKQGWRLTAFSVPLILIMTSLATYREKLSPLEFTLAGSFSGAFYKFKQGPKPMISGAAGGAFLGAIGGITIVGLMKLTGVQYYDIISFDQDRIDKFTKMKEEERELHRKEKMGEKLIYKKIDSDLPDDS